jgi:two-component system, OmpR family, phosphate regulon sensor histidine kinase PhoR
VSDVWLRSALVLVGIALLAFAVGAVAGPAWGWTLSSLGLLGLVADHLRHLWLLRRWAGRTLAAAVPEGRGVWEEAFALLYRRQRAEVSQRQRLARLLARSRQAGRALPYGLTILDAEHRILWCNDSAQAHFGVSADEDRGQPITNLVRQPEFVEYVAEGDFSGPLQLKTGRADGLILSIQLVPYVESQHLLLSRDVTQGARLEAMRRDFVANVSHELRTPLTVLIGFLETIKELELDPERSRDYLKLMAEQGERMQRIIDDLLTLSTLESAPEPPNDETVDVGSLLARILGEAGALSAGRQRITLDAEPGLDLLGAEPEIASVFGNLVSNAVRYTPQGGEVRLSWRRSQEGAEFSVEDTGVGIEAEHIPRLTERFYRVDHGRSRETGGTGLGLAIAKHALARHQAVLEIESTPGKGSRFTARFSARRLAARRPAGEPQAPTGKGLPRPPSA